MKGNSMVRKSGFTDLFGKVKQNKSKEDPLRKPIMKIFDANIDSPDVFYRMDEIEGAQILRKFDKSGGEPRYAGTYQILFKTDEGDRFYLIMTRVENELPVDADLESLSDELDSLIVCRYAPGVRGRIYLYGVTEEAIKRITDQYAKTL